MKDPMLHLMARLRPQDLSAVDRGAAARFLLSGTAALAIALVAPSKGATSISLEVSLGVFGGLVTAITFALAVVIQQGATWPSATSHVRASGTDDWVGLAITALFLAGSSKMTAADWSEGLATASVVLSAVAVFFGLRVVWHLLDASGGPGRRKMRVAVLVRTLTSRSGQRTALELSEYATSFRRATDRADLPDIRTHVNEVTTACRTVGATYRAAAVRLQLDVAAMLGKALVLDRVPIAAAAELRELLLATVDVAGEGLKVDEPGRSVAVDLDLAAVALGEVSRLAALLSKSAWQRFATEAGYDEHHAAQIMGACHEARERVRVAVDPDPPEQLIRRHDPWQVGLQTPEQILIWLWGHVGFEGTNQGSALYSVIEVLTGRKFEGSVKGDRQVIVEIGQHLRSATGSSAVDRANAFVDRFGGWGEVTAEIATNSIGQMRPAEWPTPRSLRPRDLYAQSPARRLKYFVPLDAASRPTLDQAYDRLARLVVPTSSSFAAFAISQYLKMDLGPVAADAPPSDRPAAAACAVMLSLMEATESTAPDQRARVQSFASRLPGPFLDAVDSFSATVIPSEMPEAGNASDRIFDRLSIVWDAASADD